MEQLINQIYPSSGMPPPVIDALEVRKNLIYCNLRSNTSKTSYLYWGLSGCDAKKRALLTAAYKKETETVFSVLDELLDISTEHIAILPHQILSDTCARKQIGIIFENSQEKDGNHESKRENELKLNFVKLIKDLLKRGVKYLRVYDLPECKSVFYYFEGYLNVNEQEFASVPSFDFSAWHEYYLYCFKKAAKKLHDIGAEDDFSVNVRLEYEKNVGFLVVDCK